MRDPGVFNRYAQTYDRYRPGYPTAMYEEIRRYMGHCDGIKSLEIGMGTGQATGPFLEEGFWVTALEPGKDLAAVARKKFAAYPRLEIRENGFLEADLPEGSFGLLYAGTAFHWIDPERGYQRAYALLRPGGVIALFWNNPFLHREDDPLHNAIQAVYEQYYPVDPGRLVLQEQTLERREMLICQGFQEVETHLYDGERTFGVEEYLGLLSTYSDHGELLANEGFVEGMRQAFLQHGGTLTVYDTVDLHLGRKPEEKGILG